MSQRTVRRGRFRFLSAIIVVALGALLFAQQQPPTNVGVNAKPAPVVITSLSVSSGPVGTAVTITGSGFGAVQGSSTVTFFSGQVATVSLWSSLSISTTVPVGATTGSVIVTVGALLSNGSTFTVTGGSSNPIAASRLPAGDATVPNGAWATSGVVGGIPTTWTNCTTAACVTLCPNVAGTGSPTCVGGSVTEATIESAANGAPDNTIVWMPAGVVSITGPRLSNSNTILRGQGANVTVLRITGDTDETCSVGSFSQRFNVCSNGGNIGVFNPDNQFTWTASSYNAGQTTITLNGHTNLRVGSPIWLDQLNDFANNHHVNNTADGYPAGGDIVIEAWGNGEVFVRAGRAMIEGHIVTSCGASVDGALCTSNTITIDNGLLMPNWRASQSPGGFYANDGSRTDFVGLEDFTIDVNGSLSAPLVFINCTNCWAKGLRVIGRNGTGNGQRTLVPVNCIHCSIDSNYLYGPVTNELVNNYGLSFMVTSQMRVVNNILAAAVAPMVSDGASYGNVIAYNVAEGQSQATENGNYIQHTQEGMNLFESNQLGNVAFDNIHAPAYFGTALRNHFDGDLRNTGPNEEAAGFSIYGQHRFYNLLGNVVGTNTSFYNNYQHDCSLAGCVGYNGYIYGLGWRGTNTNATSSGCSGPPNGCVDNDPRVIATLFRWGNYDSVTATIRWQSSEVPSGITNFSNPVPGAQTVPNSLFLSSAPCYFINRSIAWPAVGPDVTGGTMTGSGGHANKIPAKSAWDAMVNDTTNFGGSSPAIKQFDRQTLYGC